MRAHAWRGNIRELAHELERAVIFSAGRPLDFAALGPPPSADAAAWRHPAWRLPAEGFSLDDAINAFVAEAMRETGGNVSAAARRLDVTRDVLRHRLEGGSNATSR